MKLIKITAAALLLITIASAQSEAAEEDVERFDSLSITAGVEDASPISIDENSDAELIELTAPERSFTEALTQPVDRESVGRQ